MRIVPRVAIVLFLLFPLLTASAAEYSWQRPHAEVIETGDLKWAPEPFAFEPGESVRCIDYENGDDANEGRTRETPWKHHPWDPAAAGKADAGGDADTYVFKQGVVYRGALEVPKGASGQLTRDPSWGEGEAAFYGSEQITGGWKKGADHPRIPEPGKVWHTDLDFAPRTLWMTEAGETTRIAIARRASLANEGDFIVGRGPEGDYFAGTVDFLRVALGTLADAHTMIEELYAWQFNGPQLRDFTGARPAGPRDAGAIELTTGR